MAAKDPAYYDAVIFIDLDKAESMIAMPFHPSNAYTIHEFQQNAREIVAAADAEADRLFGKGTLNLLEKYRDGVVRADSGSIADYALCRRVPEYAGICRKIQAVENERLSGKRPEALMALLGRVGNARELAGTTQFGSCLFARRPGDGSAREQAASCQKSLGGLADMAYEYATKRRTVHGKLSHCASGA